MADVLIASAAAWDGTVPRNLGDEALTAGLAAAITRRGHRVVSSLNGVEGSDRLPADRVCLSRPSLLVAAVRRCDLVVLGGGTLLAAHVDGATGRLPRGHPRYLGAVAAAARAARRPVALVGVGAERWPTGAEEWLLRRVVRGASALFLRDDDSVALVAARTGRRGRVSGDAFFGGDVPPPVPTARRSGEAVVALSGRTSRQEVAAVAAHLLHHHEGPVLVRRMDQAGDDDLVAHDLVARLLSAGRQAYVAPRASSWSFVYQEVAHANLLVASRLHALVFAARARTPSVAVGSSPKVRTFAAEADVPLLTADAQPRCAAAEYLFRQSTHFQRCVDELLEDRSDG